MFRTELPRSPWRYAVVTVSMALALAACSASKPAAGPSLPTLPSEADRAELHRVGIALMEGAPAHTIELPVIGQGAGVAQGAFGGAAKGFSGSAEFFRGGSCSGAICGAVAVLMLGTVAVATLGGAIYGGVSGGVHAVPTGIANQIEQSLSDVIQSDNLQRNMNERLFAATAPLAADDKTVFPIQGTACGENSSLVDKHLVDAIIEACVESIGMTGEDGSDPSLSLVVTVRARLIRSRDRAELYDRTLSSVRPHRRLSEWKAEDYSLLRDELYRASSTIAERAIAEMFVLARPHSASQFNR